MGDKKTYMDKYNEQVNDLKIVEQKSDNNYNPDAFKVVDKKYEDEEKLLSKLQFESEQDKYVFEALPLLPTQKLEIVYQLIVEGNDCVKVDEELRKDIISIVKNQSTTLASDLGSAE